MEEETTNESQEQSSESPVEEKPRDEREMHKTKCTQCGSDCEVPFKPKEGRDVLCKECYGKKRKPRFDRNGGNNRNFNRERKMHDAVCGECKKDCQVPFKPSGDKKVLCKECFIKSKEGN